MSSKLVPLVPLKSLKRLEEIFERNLTLPSVGAPCLAKIDDLKMKSMARIHNWQEMKGSKYEEYEELMIFCHLLNLSPSVFEEEITLIVQLKSLITEELKRGYSMRLHTTLDNINRQLPLYIEFQKTSRDEIAAKWAPPIPASAAKAASAIPSTSSLFKPITGPTLPLFGKPLPPSPFTEGGKRKRKQKQTKKVRKHRRKSSRTSRS